jgi:hypothetical protein
MSARQLRGGSGGDMARAPWRLTGRWEVVPRPVIGGTAEHPAQVDFALLHPGRGIALVDLAPRETVHAVALLRQVLDAARLDARHPSQLPIAYLCLAPEEVPLLPRLLDAAFAAKPPLTVADADWTATVRALLAARLPAPVARPARATARGGRWSGMALVAATLLLLAFGGDFVIFGLLGFPATPPRGGAVVDATPLLVVPEATRLSVAAERLRAAPGPQLAAAAQELSPAPQAFLPEAAADPATAALAAATLALPAPSLVFRDRDVIAPPAPAPTSEDPPAPAATAQIAAPPASPAMDLAGLAALPGLGNPPSVAPPSAASAPLAVAVLPAVGILPAPTRPPPPPGFGFAAVQPPESAAPSLLEPPATPPAKVAALPPPDPIGPARPHPDGRGDAAQLLEAALPPPPPLVSAPTTRGDRSPPATRTTLPRARGAAAEVVPRQPASPRCAAILARLQLGETPSHADRSHLHTVCAPRP